MLWVVEQIHVEHFAVLVVLVNLHKHGILRDKKIHMDSRQKKTYKKHYRSKKKKAREKAYQQLQLVPFRLEFLNDSLKESLVAFQGHVNIRKAEMISQLVPG
jgi:hypothetical protein